MLNLGMNPGLHPDGINRGKLRVAVDVIERHPQALLTRIRNERASTVNRNGLLPSLIGRDAGLRATHDRPQRGLGQTETFANCFDRVHRPQVSAALILLSISGADL